MELPLLEKGLLEEACPLGVGVLDMFACRSQGTFQMKLGRQLTRESKLKEQRRE